MKLPLIKQNLDYTCGAVCVQSLLEFFNLPFLSEMEIAQQLGTLELGFTPPENIVLFIKKLNLEATLIKNANLQDLKLAFDDGNILFVTWWDEDAGHYSLIQNMEKEDITLMDPWLARQGLWNNMKLYDFEKHWKARGAVFIKVAKQHKA